MVTVAEIVSISPLDRGSVIGGHLGLTRTVGWVDIIHAPAEKFVRPGDLVLTTGADVRQPGVREFLAYLLASRAAGVVLSPPPEAPIKKLLPSLVDLADRNHFPVLFLPWDVPFADVMRSVLHLFAPSNVQGSSHMVIGRRERAAASWHDLGNSLAYVLNEVASAAGATVETSVTDGLIMSRFVGYRSESILDAISLAQERVAFPADLINWTVFPPHDDAPGAAAPAMTPSLAGCARGSRQFVEVLRHHPGTLSAVIRTLQPLIDYDASRRGQLVRTLEVVLREGTNTSAAARSLFLNRHSLLYRIKLIEQLTHLSLKNPADRFHLEVSVRVHQMNAAHTSGSYAIPSTDPE